MSEQLKQEAERAAPELAPCPFCGGTDTFVERLDYSAAYVQCDSRIDEHSACLARGPVGVQDDDGEEIPGATAAILAWNEQAARRTAAVVADDGLPPPGIAAYAIVGKDGAYTAEQVRQAQRVAIAADRAARAQQQAQSIDTPEFQALVGKWERSDEGEAKQAWGALIAYIDGRTAGAAPAWQPIETAPKDGRAVLLSRPDSGGSWIGKYEPVYQSGYRPDNPWSSLMLNRDYLPKPIKSSAPTHWMPLPAAPSPQQRKE